MSKKKIKYIGICASIATILGTIFTIYSFFQDRQDTKTIEVKGDNSGIIVSGDKNDVEQNIVQDLSVDEIKKKAQESYDNNRYKEVIDLYLMDKVQDDPVVLNNLGYMYAKGIGTKENINKAYKYFRKNVERNQNVEYVLPNYVLFLLDSKKEEFIKEGIWIVKHKELQKSIPINEQEYINSSYSLNDTYTITDDEYNNFLKKYYVDTYYYLTVNAAETAYKNEFLVYMLVTEYYDSESLFRRYLVKERKFSIDGKSTLVVGFINTD